MRFVAFALACVAVAGCQTLEPKNEVATTTIRGATPEPEIDHLRAAALLVDRGELAPAIPHLKAHLKSHPDAPMIRAYLAELLLKVDHVEEAKSEYERFIREATERDDLAQQHLVHAHTKLMEIAAEADDEFHEQLHRGIALLLLARECTESNAEPTLTKALVALKAAIRIESRNPRPLLYLMEVQTRLDQPGAAKQTQRSLQVHLSDPCWTTAERERIRGFE